MRQVDPRRAYMPVVGPRHMTLLCAFFSHGVTFPVGAEKVSMGAERMSPCIDVLAHEKSG